MVGKLLIIFLLILMLTGKLQKFTQEHFKERDLYAYEMGQLNSLRYW